MHRREEYSDTLYTQQAFYQRRKCDPQVVRYDDRL